MFEEELINATCRLPQVVRTWLARALSSDWLEMCSGHYESPAGSFCPIAAAARMAGVWRAQGISAGNAEWGDSGGPSPQVEEFVAYFDLTAEELGLDRALKIVRRAVDGRNVSEPPIPLAAA